MNTMVRPDNEHSEELNCRRLKYFHLNRKLHFPRMNEIFCGFSECCDIINNVL